MRFLYCFMFLFLPYTAVVLGENSRNGKENVLPDWALGGFKRPQGVNPIISPNEKTNFFLSCQTGFCALGI